MKQPPDSLKKLSARRRGNRGGDEEMEDVREGWEEGESGEKSKLGRHKDRNVRDGKTEGGRC